MPGPRPPAARAPARNHVPVLASPPSSPGHSREASSISTVLNPTAIDPCSVSDRLDDDQGLDQDPDNDRAYYTAHGRFAGQVAAAIDRRAGFIQPVTSHLVPLVDAPLFGELNLPSQSCILHSTTELPSRADADQLVDVYWRYVDPIEPILDRDHFTKDYEASYCTPGASLRVDHDIWLSILNTVFALAIQRQEGTPLKKRNEAGNRYFRRAWAFVPAESILWKPGSIELVQCLMLMNRYLHCTNNQQKTWMTAGLAMRIAQTICCHLPETPSTRETDNEKRLKRKIWASCVALDRCVSWSLGKTSTLVLVPSPDSGCQQNGKRPEHLRWELHEIGNQIQLAQTQSRSSPTKDGVLHLCQQDKYHTVAVHLDACLNKWENSLPSDWQLQNIRFMGDNTSRAERYMLHLRLLHSRIYLYRPMLARFYSMKSDPQSKHTKPTGLSDRLLKECAGMCVEAAQKVTSMIIETLEVDETIGLLPWWNRIYYLHIAGAIFLAAMFGSDLFTESVSQSWHDVLSALHAHVHLTTYAQQCVWTFETLSARILGTNCPTLHGGDEALVEGTAICCFDDIFQDIRFDFDTFLYGSEDPITIEGLS
ncbi:CCAAT-binding transcription factor subunit B [Penicillium atrosanguineum]|uniref:CCAAT-binding transcription factor subunit B n=1 Tax=Penicillium atrosanguineum TaxID=1132637 RepID=UPI00239BB9BC|nr:CCAAT-binding transcription factor subunit B [Penicillium atrosanguineum]KAJ5310835.1 CCAAT-binding transcription factor subunit B [Penicillium atrosanguineum]